VSCITSSSSSDDIGNSAKGLLVYNQMGNYDQRWWTSMRWKGASRYLVGMRDGQNAIVNDMLSTLEGNRSRIRNGEAPVKAVTIRGDPGTGKSGIAVMFALKWGSAFTTDLTLTTPGTSLKSLLGDMEEDQKIVIVMLKRCVDGEVSLNQSVPTPVYDKETCNGFFDNLEMYDNVFVILTMNSSYEEIDAMDPSLLREGRIGRRYTL